MPMLTAPVLKRKNSGKYWKNPQNFSNFSYFAQGFSINPIILSQHSGYVKVKDFVPRIYAFDIFSGRRSIDP